MISTNCNAEHIHSFALISCQASSIRKWAGSIFSYKEEMVMSFAAGEVLAVSTGATVSVGTNSKNK